MYTARALRATDSLELTIGQLEQRWPGGWLRTDEMHRLLRACGDALGSVPAQRWILEDEADVPSLSDGQLKCIRHGGYVEAERFDSIFFSISPAEVSWMDPHQRLLLSRSVVSGDETMRSRHSMLRAIFEQC